MEKTQTNLVRVSLGTTGVDLHLELHGQRLRAALLDALRNAVRDGRLVPGTRLPASRTLAADLGIARSTVTECYTELVAEGWFTAKQGSATRVAQLAQPVRARVETRSVAPGDRLPVHGLAPGAAVFAEFPRAQWLTAARRALSVAPPSAFGYGDPLGRLELRTALADYLARARGVRAEPEHIVIASGFHSGLGVLARALVARGAGAVAVEAYGLGLYRSVLAGAGLRIPPLLVDEDGARIAGLVGEEHREGTHAALLTPAHQFPTGFALSPERRAAALDWARRTGGVILEDDYDGEFRYDRKPVGALQGLDPEHVVYFGTASKSLAPALRLSWMVVPEHLLADVAAAKGSVETVSVLDQLTLAEFITSGAFDRHVRARRQSYRRRREGLIGALTEHAPGVTVTGLAAGLQAVIQLPPGTERRVVDAAARSGLSVTGMSEFRHPVLDGVHPASDIAHPELDAGQKSPDAIVVNFSAVPDSAWDAALAALCAVMSNI